MDCVYTICFWYIVQVPHEQVLTCSLLISNVVWHSTTLCQGNAASTRFSGAKLTSCVRPPLEFRPRLHGPRMSREVHEMAVKSSILSKFCGAELVCQCAHWANGVRQFFFRAGLAQTRLSSRSSSACDWSNCCLIRPGREEQDKQTNLSPQESH